MVYVVSTRLGAMSMGKSESLNGAVAARKRKVPFMHRGIRHDDILFSKVSIHSLELF